MSKQKLQIQDFSDNPLIIGISSFVFFLLISRIKGLIFGSSISSSTIDLFGSLVHYVIINLLFGCVYSLVFKKTISTNTLLKSAFVHFVLFSLLTLFVFMTSVSFKFGPLVFVAIFAPSAWITFLYIVFTKLGSWLVSKVKKV